MTAFGLVIALSWKDAIKATVVYLMPNNDASTLYGVYVTAARHAACNGAGVDSDARQPAD